MHQQAFETLGIQPTNDGRTIRAAFVRLARIYHPDRFSGMPEDVRVEAERRMKEAGAAYELLRGAKQTLEQPSITDEEVKERARKYRDALRARTAAEEKTRARWRRWEQIERAAHTRAEMDAQIAAQIRGEADGPPGTDEVPPPKAEPTKEKQKGPEKPRSLLSQRLDSARRGPPQSLIPRSKSTR